MRRTLIALLLLTAPRAALACPVCFGDVTSPMAAAANKGIIAMLVVVGCVLAAFASFFVYLARRAHMVGPESGYVKAETGGDLVRLPVGEETA